MSPRRRLQAPGAGICKGLCTSLARAHGLGMSQGRKGHCRNFADCVDRKRLAHTGMILPYEPWAHLQREPWPGSSARIGPGKRARCRAPDLQREACPCTTQS